jgi:mannose-6-phosphate isomerase-like protein (cupin superfamily)
MKVERPWGSYETLYESNSYKVKKIIVNSNQSFSLQYHNYRFEDWIVVEGSGFVQVDNVKRNCIVGDRFHIPVKTIHRATAGPEELVMIEVQRGLCDEEDIVRLEDDYGRAKKIN